MGAQLLGRLRLVLLAGLDELTYVVRTSPYLITSRLKQGEPAMTSARDILGTVALEPAFDIEELSAVLQSLTDLDRVSTACATAMIAAEDAAEMISAIRAALDCADIAASAQRVLSRGTAMDLRVARAILEAAAVAAERSAAECGRHASHHGHCRVHAESAREAAERCRSVLESLTG